MAILDYIYLFIFPWWNRKTSKHEFRLLFNAWNFCINYRKMFFKIQRRKKKTKSKNYCLDMVNYAFSQPTIWQTRIKFYYKKIDVMREHVWNMIRLMLMRGTLIQNWDTMWHQGFKVFNYFPVWKYENKLINSSIKL